MRWYRSLFFKIFLWFWGVIFLAMWAAVLTNEWIEDDYFRKASEAETLHLIRMMDSQRPIIAEGRKLWRRIRPGWNLVAVPVDMLSQLPHDLEEFVDQAEDSDSVLWGQNDGWLMIGPLQTQGYLYVAVARKEWQSMLDNEDRWMVPVAMVLVVTLLCFTLVWSLTRPIRRLQTTVRKLGEGNFDVSDLKGDLHRHDEIGMLASEVVDMSDSLQRLLHSHQQLLRDVSHELRSPLTRLQIALGIARKKDQQQILAAEHDRIERAVGQVDGLVAQILDLARLQQTDTRGLQSERRHLHGQMTQWLQDAELEVEAHGLTLESALPPETLVCQWDWILVERAFDNLLRNAIRFSPQNGVLRVGATVRDRAVELWVEDQGPGVPEDELERIFAPFTQVDPARDHASGGYGIGLALVKRIVELHDGIVVATNQSQGLRVAMTLPIGK
ncbi:ATP-binding protein [Thalassolituus marinus]|uniref:histidine kinase n=1 Tax=Thalassolituus marinus TaxID=671053 RepID=A0ABS7ZNE5_9GAMM|nr:ATP-binding protein [Thalassolituus marinus]MCA6063237.1 HAMP domain-containing protein [Thalassolituus marinus]